MTLTVDDRTYIQDVVVTSITTAIEELLLPRFDTLERGVAILKQDVALIKQDVIALKQDVAVLQRQMTAMSERMEEIDGRLIAIEADVKELYVMHSDSQRLKKSHADEAFARFSVEKQIQILNEELLITAAAIGIKLPRRSQ